MTQEARKRPIVHSNALLHCLEIIARLKNHRLSVQSLRAGLPIGPHGIPPESILQALTRFQLHSKIISVSLGELSSSLLPCILILKDGNACVLLSVEETEAYVYYPDHKESVIQIRSERLQELYSGKAILIAHQPLDVRNSSLPLSWFWETVKHFHHNYRSIFWSSLVIGFFILLSTIYTMVVYDRVVGSPTKSFDTLFTLSLGLTIVYIVDFYLKWKRGARIEETNHNTDILLSAHIYEKILGLKFAHRPLSAGAFAHHMTQYESVRDFLGTSVMSLTDSFFSIVFLAGIMWVSPIMALVPLVAIILILGVSFSMRPSTQGAVKNVLSRMEFRHAVLMESIAGLESIKISNAEGYFLHLWEQSVSDNAIAADRLNSIMRNMANIIGLIQNLAYMALIILGVFLIFAGTLSVGGLIACTILTQRAVSSAANVSGVAARYNQAKMSLTMLDELINSPAERPMNIQYIQRHKFLGNISFVDVDFSYPDQQVKALKNLSFQIKAGEKVGLIGNMGSGKSTLERLILGLYSPDSGTILFDGVDSRQLDPSAIRGAIGYLPQDIFLFHGTVRQNIAMANPVASDEQILAAAKVAGVEDFIRLHPHGYDMMIPEGGGGLSGGQRQCVALARALLNDSPILLLDEPSNFMDTNAEALLIQRLKEFIPDKTVLIVTHRNSVLSLLDRLILLDQGSVVVEGTKDFISSQLSQNSPMARGEQ